MSTPYAKDIGNLLYHSAVVGGLSVGYSMVGKKLLKMKPAVLPSGRRRQCEAWPFGRRICLSSRGSFQPTSSKPHNWTFAIYSKMAAIGMMVGGAVVNALAFTGVNYMFSMFGSKSGEAEKERKRHDLAIEQLQRAESEYQHKRQLRLDYLNKQLRAEQHSMQVFEDVDAAAREYWVATGGDQEKLDKVPDAGAEPTLNEYCEPSDTQKEYELLFMVGGLALTG